MKTFPIIAILITSLTFLYYGFAALFSNYMKQEFERYQFSQYRTLTGTLQILGAIGLLLGIHLNPLLIAASSGFAVMMLAALGIRKKIQDPFLEKIPAIIYLALSLYILHTALSSLT